MRPRLIWGDEVTSTTQQLSSLGASGILSLFGREDPLTSTCHVRNVCEGVIAAAKRVRRVTPAGSKSAAFLFLLHADARSQGKPGSSYYLTDGETLHVTDFVPRLVEAATGKKPRMGIFPLVRRSCDSFFSFVWPSFHAS